MLVQSFGLAKEVEKFFGRDSDAQRLSWGAALCEVSSRNKAINSYEIIGSGFRYILISMFLCFNIKFS